MKTDGLFDLKDYQQLLETIRTKYLNLRKGGVTFSTLEDCAPGYQQEWLDLGTRLFKYIRPLGDSRIEYVQFVCVGGECVIARGRDSLTGHIYSCKVALPIFNEPDEIITKKKTFFGKDQETIIVNEYRDRFIRGLLIQKKVARAFDRFRYGSIPKVLDTSTKAPVYSILEWVDGETYADFVAENFATPDGRRVIVNCYWKILQCYRNLHSHGIIHRDVKPENILIDKFCNVYLIDFVVTKELNKADSALTVEGTYLGDMRYSAPEQVILGRAGLSTYKSDVYSLGELLYFVLTGDHPPMHVHEKRLRTKQQNLIPSVFRELFMSATQDDIERRPDIEDFISAFEDTCRAEGINFEIADDYIEPQETKELSRHSQELRDLRGELERVKKILRDVGGLAGAPDNDKKV